MEVVGDKVAVVVGTKVDQRGDGSGGDRSGFQRRGRGGDYLYQQSTSMTLVMPSLQKG